MMGFHMGPDIRLSEVACQRLSESRHDYRPPMGFGARVTEMRELRGLSKAALAKSAGVSPSTVTEIESGKNETSRYLTSIARALAANPEYLSEGRLPKEAMSHQVNALLPTRKSGQVSIPQLDVQGSMGPGAIPPDHIDVVRNLIVDRNELAKQCSFTSPQNLQVITGYGRSMRPTFSDGDPLLIDTGVSTVTIDGVYVFEIDGELYIKGLQRIPGNGLRVISHNREEFDPWDISKAQMERMRVRGRVVLAWNSRRL